MRDSESLRLGSNPSPGADLIIFLLLSLLFLPQTLLAAVSEWKVNPQGQVRLISEYDVAPESGTLRLGLHFKPTPGWTLYWKNAGDAGIPPKVSWDGSTGIKEAELLWPAPTHLILPGDINEYGYDAETVYPVQAVLTGQPIHLKALVSYLTCKESCIPYKYFLILDLPSGQTPVTDVASSALISGALTKIPPSNLSDQDVQNKAPVVHLDPQAPASAPVSVASGLTLSILLLAFLGGVILNVMPCVLPVLSIKLIGLLQHGGQSRGIVTRDALASAAGILVSFLILALAAIGARHAGQSVGWGIQFQNPFFIAFLAIVLVLFTLNLWGVFEITLPLVLSRVGAVNRDDEGWGSYFVGGLFATLLATPCSAPFLGTAMGFALAQSGRVIVAIFLAVGVGMAVPYLILAVFPGTMRWMPRPGAWMLLVKTGLGFFLAATVLWLGYVLSSQIDSVGVVYFGLSLLGLSFLIWLREVFSEKNRATAPWSMIGSLFVLVVIGIAFRVVSEHRLTSSGIEATSGGLPWIPFDEGAISGHLAKGESVFVDVTADWCFTCKVNEKAVLQSGEIMRVLKDQGIVLMRADWTNHNTTIADYLKKQGRAGIPFYALYRPGRPPVLLSEFLTKTKVLDALKN